MKRFVIIICVLVTCFSLSGCMSKEAKSVSDKIKGIGTVTVESKDLLDEIQAEYTALSQEDKDSIKNYSLFEDACTAYTQAYAADFDERVESAVSNVTTASRKGIDELLAEYDKMDKGTKDEIKNYEKLVFADEQCHALDLDQRIAQAVESIDNSSEGIITSLIKEYEALSDDIKEYVGNSDKLYEAQDVINKMKAESTMEDILSRDEDNYGGIIQLLNQNKTILSEEEIREGLLHYSKYLCLGRTETEIKSRLSDADSYSRTAYTFIDPTEKESGEYLIKVGLSFDSTELLSGTTNKTVVFDCLCLVDTENIKVTADSVKFAEGFEEAFTIQGANAADGVFTFSTGDFYTALGKALPSGYKTQETRSVKSYTLGIGKDGKTIGVVVASRDSELVYLSITKPDLLFLTCSGSAENQITMMDAVVSLADQSLTASDRYDLLIDLVSQTISNEAGYKTINGVKYTYLPSGSTTYFSVAPEGSNSVLS